MNSHALKIELQPFSPGELLALVEGVDAFRRQFGRPAAEGLRDFYVSGEVSEAWLEQLRRTPQQDPWTVGFAVVELASGLVIGSAGFKGPPNDEGMVEVAYAIVPTWQGKGCATAALGKLITFALADERVRVLHAHTLPENNASTRVLAKNGFAKLGEVMDPEDGRVWRWERKKAVESHSTIRVVLPFHLRNLARVEGEVQLDVSAPITIGRTLDAIEAKYPMLQGTIRDHGTLKRRPFIRYFACKEDLSHEPPETVVPDAVVKGEEPFLVVGAMAGG